MIYKEVLKKIYKEKSNFKKSVDSNDRLFLINFLEKYPTNDFNTWSSIPLSYIAAINLLSSDYEGDISMKSLSIFDYLSYDSINGLIEYKPASNDDATNDEFAKALYKDTAMYNSELLNINASNKTISRICKLPFEVDDFKVFIHELKEYDSNLNLSMLFDLAKINDYYKKLKERYDNRIKPSIIKRVLQEEVIFISDLDMEMQNIYDYAKKIANGLTSKEINKTMNSFKKLIERIKIEEKKEEIKDIDALLPSCISDNLKNDILKYVYDHNNTYYEKLSKIYEDKKSNSILEYIAYFKSIGLDFNKLNNKTKLEIRKDNLDIIKEKMKYISKFTYIEDYFKVLTTNSVDDLTVISNFVKKEYLTNDFIKENISLLINPTIKENVIKNIPCCLRNKINIKKYIDKSFLLTNNITLNENILLLKEYNIPYEKCNNLNFLSELLNNKIDLFIEVGLYDYIVNDPDILNTDIDLAKRIILTKEVEEDYSKDGKILDIIINPSKFFIPSEKIDKYTLERNHENYTSASSIFLTGEVKNYSYNIDGIIIPVGRVKNNPVRLEDIIKPSLYSEEEIEKLEKLR